MISYLSSASLTMSRGEFGRGDGRDYGAFGGGRSDLHGQGQSSHRAGYQREGNAREEIQNLSDSVSSSIFQISVSSSIFQINNNTSALERILRQITSGKDKVSAEKIHRIQQGTNKLASETTHLLKQMSTMCGGTSPSSRQQRIQHERLKKEFRDSVSRYYSVQNKVAEQEKLIVRSTREPGYSQLDDDFGTEKSSLIEEDSRRASQEQLSEQITIDEGLIYEREERIRQIEGDILDINAIFRDLATRDLATMVYEQGETIDFIEGNIEQDYNNVGSANIQLQKASKLQEKTIIVADNSARLGLNINRGKSKVFKTNASNETPITVQGEALEEVDTFTYLGSILDNKGGTDADIRTRIGKARAAFYQLKNIWGSSEISITTKIRLFNTIIKPILLYGVTPSPP
ncbi:syntaxin-7 isoform X1 [Nematostella vectensis]|uniref:syntaxin-7 isoform X1 n=2 Tax=Nematostella vectensis TaxID=45351 RepID=UPI002076FC57|nr:syntaxin-7 isoform X1 [Nematostella vectensis]